MKRNGRVVLAMLLVMVSVPLAALAAEVPIKSLNLAPWLGKLSSSQDLAEKFTRQKQDFVGYIQHDLEVAAGLRLSIADSKEIVDLMESQIKAGETKLRVVEDGTKFLSMGWRSKSGKIMRTASPVLRLGKLTYGFPVTIEYGEHKIEYLFLAACGNIVLREVKELKPPKAEVVPPARMEAAPAEPPKERIVEKEVPKYIEVPKIVERVVEVPRYVYISQSPQIYYQEPMYYPPPPVHYSHQEPVYAPGYGWGFFPGGLSFTFANRRIENSFNRQIRDSFNTRIDQDIRVRQRVERQIQQPQRVFRPRVETRPPVFR